MSAGAQASTIEVLATLARLGVCIRRRGSSLDYRAPRGPDHDLVARYIDRHRRPLLDTCAEIADYNDTLFPLTVTSNGTLNVICLHPISGNVFDYRHLAAQLAGECSVFGVQAHRWFITREVPATLSEMASFYASRLAAHPLTTRPFVLYGASSGGYLALEIAKTLAKNGKTAELVVLGDTRDLTGDATTMPTFEALLTRLRWVSFVDFCLPPILQDIGSSTHEFWRLADASRIEYLVGRALQVEEAMCFASLSSAAVSDLFAIFGAYSRALADHAPSVFSGPAAFLATSDAPMSRTAGIRSKLAGGYSLHRIGGSHIEALRERGAKLVAEIVRGSMTRSGSHARGGRRSDCSDASPPIEGQGQIADRSGIA